MSDSNSSDAPPNSAPQATASVSETGSLVIQDQILPPNLFILPVSQAVVYPTLMAPILVSIPRFVATVEESINRQRLIGLVMTSKSQPDEKTGPEDIYQFGVVARVLKRLKMPDGSVNILVHSMKRFHIKRYLSDTPHLVVEAEYLEDVVEKSNEMDALTRSAIAHVKRLAEVNPFFTEEMRLAMINAPGPGTVADIVAFALSLPKEQAQEILETLSVKTRFEKLLVHLRREQDVADLQKKIHDDVNTKLNTMQREYFLREQLKVIKRELGMEEDGKEKAGKNFREKIESAGMPEAVKKAALEELQKFETLSEQSPEYNVSRNYLEMICALPWSKETVDQLNLSDARKILEADHFGLEKVKDRIIEFLAVRKLLADQGGKIPAKGSIICLVGPPGVGKTSIGKSVARALGRNFFRFSLGGMRDEAEIKGHRRTYVGALPGKILNAMKRAGTKNPVLLLDEIDKLGASFQGDPGSALLEVLDPEQNSTFIDNYLDLPFDLSKVLFIATANNLSSIPPALLDRMEVIEIPGYTLEEKIQIARKYVIPKVLESAGLKASQIKLNDEALKQILSDYAREPGMRTLQQLIEKISRKAAAQVVENGRSQGPIKIEKKDLLNWLGPVRYYNEVAERITVPGIMVGLAWTAAGGDILFIEATDFPGSGGFKLTGQMGEVMTESADIAWSFVKKKLSEDEKIGSDFFKDRDIHLHIPAGAIPKDGPSAGITMATALYSLFSGRVCRQGIAMTGELSLVGKVLPVGGIKEKILAAKRVGIRTIILPKQNQKDFHEIPAYATKGMTFHFVNRIEEVFDLVLLPSKRSMSRIHAHQVKLKATQNENQKDLRTDTNRH